MTISGYTTEVIHDGFAFTGKSVKQGAFSYVGSSYNGYNSTHSAKIDRILGKIRKQRATAWKIGQTEACDTMLQNVIKLFDLMQWC